MRIALSAESTIDMPKELLEKAVAVLKKVIEG